MPAACDLTFVISADYARLTGGWIYNRRLLRGLAERGWRIRHVVLPAGFPEPSQEARKASAAAFAAIPDGALVLADQLCLGVLPEVAAAEGRRLRLVMIVHHPLAFEGNATPAARAWFTQAEMEALRHVAAALVTSPTTARTLMAAYAVPGRRLIVAVPGADPQPLSRGSGGPIPNLLSVGAIVPRKDHGALIEALGGLRHLPWRLAIAGNLSRAPRHVGALRARIAATGLSTRIELLGEVPDARLTRLWAATDLYVSASRHEGYGMAIAEAFAHGIPVVTTAAGAAGAWIGRRGALVVPGGNPYGLRAALSDTLAHASRRAALRAGAVARRRTLPTWEATAATADRELTRILEAGS